MEGRLAEVRGAIEGAAARAERDPAKVTLVAVSKTWPADVVMEAIAAGVTDLGENRAGEFKEKVALLGEVARWHFVGNLQTNKVRQVVGACALVHSVDRIALAEAISRRATSSGLVQDVLVEVNIARDPSKHGVEPERAGALTRAVDDLPGVKLRGLMTMPPYPDRAEESRPFYRDLAALSRQLVAEAPHASDLSMGMSRDFEVAIEEGATMVRVGTAVFGPRRGR